MPRAGDIREFRLEDGGVALSLLNLGCITRGWWVPLGGTSVPVVLGFDDPAEYLQNPTYMGVIAGRVANRIGGARFSLDGRDHRLTANEGANQLHGGAGGLHSRIWQAETEGARAVRFTYVSPDGEEGYPGRASFEVTVRLDGARVTYDMAATVDRPTPINMAQHSYYSLGTEHLSRAARFTCPADRYTPVDSSLIPTGDIAPVKSTRHDFRAGAVLVEADPEGMGTDLNFVLPEGRDPARPVAELLAPNGLHLRMWSDQPGLQVYTGHGLPNLRSAHAGQRIAPWAGIALEPQGFPNAVNCPTFPSIIVTPEQPYHQRLTVEIMEVPE
ncbi:aldose epimerase family protein [Nioella sp. MMSF_3534]|uniref:aldose epimerase family protein n=1 Tax=Nioella sp. MMSF_3534 TaxID=3046720 RepID=UPI00273D8560|nr:aldose epimerase family protein [Nioella sp. MMSF_3534]